MYEKLFTLISSIITLVFSGAISIVLGRAAARNEMKKLKMQFDRSDTEDYRNTYADMVKSTRTFLFGRSDHDRSNAARCLAKLQTLTTDQELCSIFVEMGLCLQNWNTAKLSNLLNDVEQRTVKQGKQQNNKK